MTGIMGFRGESSILIGSAWLAPLEMVELDLEKGGRDDEGDSICNFRPLFDGRGRSSSDSVEEDRLMVGGELGRPVLDRDVDAWERGKAVADGEG
jgi:hypothetical protein